MNPGTCDISVRIRQIRKRYVFISIDLLASEKNVLFIFGGNSKHVASHANLINKGRFNSRELTLKVKYRKVVLYFLSVKGGFYYFPEQKC